MSRRNLLAILLAVAAAALFARLGFWQLSRLHQRRQHNAQIAARLDSVPVPLRQLPADTALAKYRRAIAAGRWDYGHELLLTFRSRNGSPGVNFITPLRLPGTDTAVLVNRGWAYSPDGETVDRVAWREGDSARVMGLVEEFYRAPRRVPYSAEHPRALAFMDYHDAASRVPYPILPVYLIEQGGGGPRTPVRIPPPALDEGPHMSYAIQWFSFAVIALAGVAFLLVTQRAGERVIPLPPAPPYPRRVGRSGPGVEVRDGGAEEGVGQTRRGRGRGRRSSRSAS